MSVEVTLRWQRGTTQIIDRAGFHTSKDLEVPEGIELFYLPPYTPELQPAERLASVARLHFHISALQRSACL